MTLPEFEAILVSRDLHPHRAGAGIACRCPAHEDNAPSLSVGTGLDGRILLNCHAGCSTEAVVAGLGLTMRDLFPPGSASAPRARYVMTRGGSASASTVSSPRATTPAPPAPLSATAEPKPRGRPKSPGKQVAVYPYVDESGTLLFEVVRYEPKTFRQRVRDSSVQGGYTYSTASIPDKPVFRLPAVLSAIDNMTTVFVVEGEKDVLALEGIGLTATTCPGGAGKFTESQANSLRGATVVVLADKDAVGIAHAEDVRAKLEAAGASVVAAFPLPDRDVGPVKDAADFVEAGGTATDILLLAQDPPPLSLPDPDSPPQAPGTPTNGVNGHAAPTATTPQARAAGLGAIFSPNEAQIRADLLAAVLSIRNDPALSNAAARRNVLISIEVVTALCRLGQFYFNVDFKTSDGCLYFDRHRKLLLPIQSDLFKFWLSEWAVVPRHEVIWDAVFKKVEHAALVGPLTQPVTPESYWASREDPVTSALTIYVSNGDGHVIRINAAGLRQVDNGTDGVLFAVGKTLRPWNLTAPVDPFTTCRIFGEMKAADTHGLLLAKLWIYSMPTAATTKPPALFTGVVGSGKTRSARGVAELYGIPEVVQKVQAEAEDDFWTAVNGGGLLILDNADTRTRWLPDALAASATGGTVSRRVLYTNSDTMLLRAKAWVIVTSANPSFASDAGLADRLAVVRMERNEKDTEDASLSREVTRARDSALSHIVSTLQSALADTTPIPSGLNYRFPDFGRLAYRIGKALGLETETMQALAAAEADKAAICIENDPVLTALLGFIRASGQFRGTAKELGTQLSIFEPDIAENCSAIRLAKRLRNHWSHIKSVLEAFYEESRNSSAIFTFRMKDE